MKIIATYDKTSFSANEKSVLKGIYKRKKSLSKEERILENLRGSFAGLDAKKRGVEECKEIIIRETLAGNTDYLKGFNKTIGKEMAKKAYAAIGK